MTLLERVTELLTQADLEDVPSWKDELIIACADIGESPDREDYDELTAHEVADILIMKWDLEIELPDMKGENL